jgi:hypothetical protein
LAQEEESSGSCCVIKKQQIEFLKRPPQGGLSFFGYRLPRNQGGRSRT